jgi:dipeptidyl aminopeptidase/acylaminoacyl peptidase
VQVHIIDYVKQFPDQMIVGINKDDPRLHDAYHLNLVTGRLELVAKNPGNVVAWFCDAELKVRGAQAALEGGFAFSVRDHPDGEWRLLVEWTSEDGLNSSPIGFTRDGSAVYLVDSRNFNTGRLIKLHIDDGAIEVLAEDANYDVGAVRINEDTYDVEMVAFNRARRDWVVLDSTLDDDIEAIRRVNPGDFSIYNNTSRNDIWLVGFTQDNGPIAYYAFDRRMKEARLLFHNRPELTTASLAPMRPISFVARDGLTIHGYLTKPLGAPSHAPLPMVLNVHGGPWHRDTWGYNAEAQWLANRGYACLQVNYRGSTGYGKAFLNAGNREWGGRMHDDLVDAVQWAIGEGVADTRRIAIYGGSYGGYAALVGATFTPDLFCCAVDIVGVSNLITFIKSIPPYWSAFLNDLHQRVGNPDTDAAFLRERSPLFRADQIRIPILIAQGANDPRVKQAEAEQIVEAMKRNGVDYEYLLFPDEGHGFAKPANNIRFYAAAEKFLAKHLGGRAEP